MMSIFIWAVLGLSIGFIANKLINHQGGDSPLNMVLGITGAIDGSFMFNFMVLKGLQGALFTFCCWQLLARQP